jgi:hypothetical protein
MNLKLAALWVLAGSAIWVAAATAQIEPPNPNGAASAAGFVLTDPAARVRDIAVQLEAAKLRLDLANQRYKAGQDSADHLRDAQTDVTRLEIAYEEARKAERRQAQTARLLQTVDVDLKNATLAQAAQSLSKAGNLPVHVDPADSGEARITLSAHRAQVRAVLDALARNLGLRIDPSDDGGVELHPWPEVEVNGQKQIFTEPSPWSPAWGTTVGGITVALPSGYAYNPTGTIGSLGGRGAAQSNGLSNSIQNPNVTGTRNNLSSQQVTNGLTLNSGQIRYTPAGLLQGVNIAAVGDAVIVAEPGRGPHGEPGAWLTVYLLDGLNLVRKSATFHPARALLVTPTDAQPSQSASPTIQSPGNHANTGSRR